MFSDTEIEKDIRAFLALMPEGWSMVAEQIAPWSRLVALAREAEGLRELLRDKGGISATVVNQSERLVDLADEIVLVRGERDTLRKRAEEAGRLLEDHRGTTGMLHDRVEALERALENCRLMAARMVRRAKSAGATDERWEAILRLLP